MKSYLFSLCCLFVTISNVVNACNLYVDTPQIDLDEWSYNLFQSDCGTREEMSFCKYGIDNVDIDDDDIFVENSNQRWYRVPRLYYDTNLWKWSRGKVDLPKTDIVNVAFRFDAPTSTFYFLMDTLTNGTDLSVGVWFLQNNVDLSDNTFSPRHTTGDFIYSMRNGLDGFLMTRTYKWDRYLTGGATPNIFTNCEEIEHPEVWFPFDTNYYKPRQLYYGYFNPPDDFEVKALMFLTVNTRYDYFDPLSDFHVLNL